MKKEAMIYKKLENKKVLCNLCAHRCRITNNGFGICQVRENIDGTLYSNSYGQLIASHIDPIEKKPFYHFLPGSKSYSIATPGCNFKCSFCQNWQISQFQKEDFSKLSDAYTQPKEIVNQAIEYGCKSISYTYTEPTIFFEYAYDIAKIAKKKGLYNTFVSNGFMTDEAIKKIFPYLDAINIDLKSFSDGFYKNICKARLQPVLESIKKSKELGIWVEITTLIVPELNDSKEEIEKITNFISSIDNNIPWHISRFHPDYNYNKSYPTPIKTLNLAYDIAKKNNLKYVYIGNTYDIKDTVCSNCNKILIKRSPFGIDYNKIIDDKCRYCNKKIEGIWD